MAHKWTLHTHREVVNLLSKQGGFPDEITSPTRQAIWDLGKFNPEKLAELCKQVPDKPDSYELYLDVGFKIEFQVVEEDSVIRVLRVSLSGGGSRE